MSRLISSLGAKKTGRTIRITYVDQAGVTRVEEHAEFAERRTVRLLRRAAGAAARVAGRLELFFGDLAGQPREITKIEVLRVGSDEKETT